LKNNQTNQNNQTRGGKRQNAGRKPGTGNRSNEEARRKVAETGETPLEYMLRVMRDPAVDHDRRDKMAAAAAPYAHSRLASVEHKGGLELTTQTKEQRDAAVAAASRADG
jgi:hypothetical protein